MSLREIISKASLRAVIALSAFFALLAMVIYIVIISVKDVKLSGSIDAMQLVTAFLTIIGLVIGWLFGRQEVR
jgi:lipopolysaccharide export LptBFGC system permease protein LptF